MPLPFIAWGAIAAGAAVASAVGGYAAYESSSGSTSSRSSRNEDERARAKEKVERENQQKEFVTNAEAVKKFVAQTYGQGPATELQGIEVPTVFRKRFDWICKEKVPLEMRKHNSDLAHKRQRKRELQAALNVLDGLE